MWGYAMTKKILFATAVCVVALVLCVASCGGYAVSYATTKQEHANHAQWKQLDSNTIALQSGKYYLNKDLTLDKIQQVTDGKNTISAYLVTEGDVTICLNGHMLKGGGNGSVIAVKSGKLTVCDCNGDNLTHAYGKGDKDAMDFDSTGWGVIDGGVICGGKVTFNGAGVYVASNTTFVLQGGTIAGNVSQQGSGGAIFVNKATFKMTGGAIRGNYAQFGSAVSFSGDCLISGGLISDNTAITGTINAVGNLNVTGGTISNNRVHRLAGAIYIYTNKTTTISGGYVGKNTADYSGVQPDKYPNAHEIQNDGGTLIVQGGYFADNKAIQNNIDADCVIRNITSTQDDANYIEGYDYAVYRLSINVDFDDEIVYDGGSIVAGDDFDIKVSLANDSIIDYTVQYSYLPKGADGQPKQGLPIDAGEYTLFVKLTTTDGLVADRMFNLTIRKAETTLPEEVEQEIDDIINEWLQGDQSEPPQISAEYGTVRYLYMQGDQVLDGKPTEAGEYKLVIVIEGSQNYNDYHKVVPFTIPQDNSSIVLWVSLGGAVLALSAITTVIVVLAKRRRKVM